MTPMRHPADGRIHISELVQHAKSPAHVRLACTRARETTRAMRVGHIADGIVFGTGKFEVYEGDRKGAKWQTALECCPPGSELVTRSEYDDYLRARAYVRGVRGGWEEHFVMGAGMRWTFFPKDRRRRPSDDYSLEMAYRSDPAREDGRDDDGRTNLR